MNAFDGMWIVLFFLASGAMSAIIGRRGKKARERRIEYFQNISAFTEEDRQKESRSGKHPL